MPRTGHRSRRRTLPSLVGGTATADPDQTSGSAPAPRDGMSYIVDPSAGTDLRNLDTPELAAIPPDPANGPSTVDIAATTTTAGVFFTVYNVVRRADYEAPGSPLPAIFGVGGFLCTRFARASTRQGFRVAADCGALC